MIIKLPIERLGITVVVPSCPFFFLLVSFVYIWYFLVLMAKLGLIVCIFGKSVKIKNRKKL